MIDTPLATNETTSKMRLWLLPHNPGAKCLLGGSSEVFSLHRSTFKGRHLYGFKQCLHHNMYKEIEKWTRVVFAVLFLFLGSGLMTLCYKLVFNSALLVIKSEV